MGKLVVYLIGVAARVLWKTQMFIGESLLPVCYENTSSLLAYLIWVAAFV